MPTYEYECKKCGKFEMFLGISDSFLKACPTCGGEVKRLFSPNVNFIFKGSGFYATEYRSQEYKKKENEEKRGAEGSTQASPKASEEKTKKEGGK